MQLVYFLLGMSISGSILTLIQYLLHHITLKTFGYKWNYCILLLCLVFYTVPVGLIINILLPDSSFNVLSQYVYELNHLFGSSSTGSALLPMVTEINGTQEISNNVIKFVGLVIWFAGFAIVYLRQYIRYRKFLDVLWDNNEVVNIPEILDLLRKQQEELKIGQKIILLRSPMVKSPSTVKTIRPIIILPQNVTNLQDIKAALTHELIHIKKKDSIYKRICLFLNCVYWFNPFIYLFVRQFNKLTEYRCDAILSEDYGSDDRFEYCSLILEYSVLKQNAFMSHFAAKTTTMKERMELILNPHKKLSLLAKAIFAVSVFGLVIVNAQIASACTYYHVNDFASPEYSECAVALSSLEYNYVGKTNIPQPDDTWISLPGEPEGFRSTVDNDPAIVSIEYFINDLGKESGASTYGLPIFCKHEYETKYLSEHLLWSDGSCTDNIYEVIICPKCAHVTSTEFIMSTYCVKCPHGYTP